MAFIKYAEVTSTRAKVWYMLADMTLLDTIDTTDGYEVKLPERPVEVVGKQIELFTNPVTREVWYEHVDRPLTDKEKVDQLTAQNAQIILTLVMNDLL